MIHGEDANGSRSCKTPASGFWNLTSKTLAQINIIVRRWPLTVLDQKYLLLRKLDQPNRKLTSSKSQMV